MSTADSISRLRHDLANPLAALLAEVQLILLGDAPIDPDIKAALQQVEQQALRMRDILRASRQD